MTDGTIADALVVTGDDPRLAPEPDQLRDELGRYQPASQSQPVQQAQPQPQWTEAQLAAAAPADLLAAIEAGRLVDLGLPPGRAGRGPMSGTAVSPLDQFAARQAATVKAASEPGSLTDADIAALDGPAVSRLMETGGLAHMGIGASKRRR